MSEAPAQTLIPSNLDDRYRNVRVTHRFHPLYGREYEFVVHRQNWGEDLVYLHDENGELFSILTGTDAAPDGPLVVVAAGRCLFTGRLRCD